MVGYKQICVPFKAITNSPVGTKSKAIGANNATSISIWATDPSTGAPIGIPVSWVGAYNMIRVKYKDAANIVLEVAQQVTNLASPDTDFIEDTNATPLTITVATTNIDVWMALYGR